MVRTYKRKISGSVYTKEDLENAVKSINEEGWSFRKASDHFKVPLSTLSSYVSNPVKSNIGRCSALTTDEESYLVKLIITLQEWDNCPPVRMFSSMPMNI
jgi:hypothetical protein